MEESTNALLIIIPLALVVFVIVAMWKVFTKAGQPGWACIIPFYNTYVMLKIAGRPGWWLLLYFIPIVDLVIHIIVMIDFARKFGKGAGFGVGLVFLSIIFMPILAFGEAKYIGAAASA
jgi:hypothetical protein